MKKLQNKKIAIIIAFKDFQDQEYLITKQALEENGAEMITASSEQGFAIGVFGQTAQVDILVKDIDMKNFDAVVFIGGQGMARMLKDSDLIAVARSAAQAGKILGAICISPCVLALAGVLQGRRATVWHSEMDKSPIKILRDNGAIFIDKSVVVDKDIVTANGPPAALEFAQTLTEVLS